MTKYIKITRDEIIELLEKTYKFKNLKFMVTNGCEKDMEVMYDFEYVIGDFE